MSNSQTLLNPRLVVALGIMLLVGGVSSLAEVEEQKPFRPYEPNYALAQFTEDDDTSLSVNYSFKYVYAESDSNKTERRWESFFKFSGEFDFYMFGGKRSSAPVVNRRSNPGFHWREYYDRPITSFLSWNYMDYGIQHLSNGQTIDAKDEAPNGETVAQNQYLLDPDNQFFDGISRGVNFASVEANFRIGKGHRSANKSSGHCEGSPSCLDLWIRVIPLYDDDNLVTWGEFNGERRVASYDIVRTILSWQPFSDKDWNNGLQETRLSTVWTFGDNLFDTDSLKVSAHLPFDFEYKSYRIKIPLLLACHIGPYNHLADYTREQNWCGLGLQFYKP